ncbi:hypothetical protein [Gottfriedia acidiceleris]|uniref:hypothetical protein n=1 Tax=Gottfriedia acidiceleris TaxID=371036 RepID=UPI003D1E5088
MPFFKKPVYEKSLTEDEVLNNCKDHGINMNRKNFRGNYLEKELAKYNAAYFHEDLNAWEFNYEYISHWVPLLLDEKHELRNKVVLSMDKKSELTVTKTGFDRIVVEDQDLNEESTQTERTTKSIIKVESHFTALANYKHGNLVPCSLCEKWTNYSKFAKHAREEHDGTTTQEILSKKENIDKMYKMYLDKMKNTD